VGKRTLVWVWAALQLQRRCRVRGCATAKQLEGVVVQRIRERIRRRESF
jgi:hypothetical protein